MSIVNTEEKQGVFGMKAADLMIGDWVGVFDDEGIIKDCRQVDWVRTGEIGMRYHKVWSIGCIEPIPLTAEILDENDFWIVEDDIRYCGDSEVWIHTYVEHLDIEKFEGRFQCYEIPDMQFNYVHQIQQALRLCGLNELADNFKV